MKFAIYRASDDDGQGTETFTTIDQLIGFMKQQNYRLVIGNNFFYNQQPNAKFKITKEMTSCKYAITIFDSYID